MTRPSHFPDIIDQLRMRFDYDPELGSFRWRVRSHDTFPCVRIAKGWNTRFAGKEAFTGRSDDGYAVCAILVDGEKVFILGHVAAFALVNGRLPAKTLDHRNGIRDDNRIENLREATHAQNMRNVVRRGKYLTGARPNRRKWEARIMLGWKPVYIGLYATELEAHQAYLAKAKELHGEFAAHTSRAAA